jgi:pyruvate kinase
MTKAKIIATIGPASDTASILRKMMRAGMDVARLNFSHGDTAQHQRSLELVRSLNKKYRRATGVLQDLEGFRIRLGEFPRHAPIQLTKRQKILLANQTKSDTAGAIPFDYRGPLTDIPVGSNIFIDDGNIEVVVASRTRSIIKAEVIVPGVLKERKGVNIPDARLRFKGLTVKDKSDLSFALRNGVEYIAQSFVRSASDMRELRDFLGGRLKRCKLIAKIENRQAVRNIDEIIGASDGIMVARGDMGVCLPLYEIPMIQKMIIRKCNRRKKPVITATQMLESMTEHWRPTRAEVTDVANAVLDGSDFLMLSAETAAGRYPVEAVKTMHDIIRFTESSRSVVYF